jgi:hypothetical protein
MADVVALARIIIATGGDDAQRASFVGQIGGWLLPLSARLGTKDVLAKRFMGDVLDDVRTGAQTADELLSSDDTTIVVAFFRLPEQQQQPGTPTYEYMSVLFHAVNIIRALEIIKPLTGRFHIRGIDSSGITLSYKVRADVLTNVLGFMEQNAQIAPGSLGGVVREVLLTSGINIPGDLAYVIDGVVGPRPIQVANGPLIVSLDLISPLLAWNVQQANRRGVIRAFIKKWNKLHPMAQKLTLA